MPRLAVILIRQKVDELDNEAISTVCSLIDITLNLLLVYVPFFLILTVNTFYLDTVLARSRHNGPHFPFELQSPRSSE